MPANYSRGPYQHQTRTAADAIQLRQARIAGIELMASGQADRGRAVGPCEGCHQRERCRVGLACVSLALFVETGRFSAVAPRQPSAAIYRRLFA
jgi:hypothetical protein